MFHRKLSRTITACAATIQAFFRSISVLYRSSLLLICNATNAAKNVATAAAAVQGDSLHGHVENTEAIQTAKITAKVARINLVRSVSLAHSELDIFDKKLLIR